MVALTHVVPNLFVSDVRRAVAFYERKLGFQTVVVDGDPPAWASVRRGAVRLGLYPGTPRVRPGLSWLYLTVADVDALYHECASAGVDIRAPLRQWGEHKEFSIADPDGNRLDIGLSLE